MLKVKCLKSNSSIFIEGEIYNATLTRIGMNLYKITSKKGYTLLSLDELEASKDFKIVTKSKL